VSDAFGFYGDEMYYVAAGQHPAFGYVDEPPITPLLSAASVAVLGVLPTAVRVLPAIEMAPRSAKVVADHRRRDHLRLLPPDT